MGHPWPLSDSYSPTRFGVDRRAGNVRHGGDKNGTSPAAALARGLVLNEWNFLTILVILVILAGIISLSVFKRLVLPVLTDLN